MGRPEEADLSPRDGASPGDSEGSPEDQLRVYARELADGIVAALPGWVIASVERIVSAYTGRVPDAVGEEARVAAAAAAAEVGPSLRELLESDPDDQRTTPLALVRAAVRYPTGVLLRAGVPPVERDAFDERAFPDDRYGLTPASLADLDPGLADVSLRWGAAKAFVHRRRHRS
ncbi:MAG: hypothetical protein KGQ66_21080 [Acidobacteriota bacterium]|nr:hypothetical protein [Acidobacteriota bacterium]